MVNESKNDNFPVFKNLFPDNNYQGQMKKLTEAIDALRLMDVDLLSIIDMDVYYFGLIYHVFIKKREVEYQQRDSLVNELRQKVAEIKHIDREHPGSNFHVKNPAALKYLRMRIRASIEIYRSYLK